MAAHRKSDQSRVYPGVSWQHVRENLIPSLLRRRLFHRKD
jgi:hypothetical protein